MNKKNNNLWQRILSEIKNKKDNGLVFAEYRVYLKSGDFIINNTDRECKEMEYQDGILIIKGHKYLQGTTLTHLNEIEMKELAPCKHFIPIENVDMITTL